MKQKFERPSIDIESAAIKTAEFAGKFGKEIQSIGPNIIDGLTENASKAFDKVGTSIELILGQIFLVILLVFILFVGIYCCIQFHCCCCAATATFDLCCFLHKSTSKCSQSIRRKCRRRRSESRNRRIDHIILKSTTIDPKIIERSKAIPVKIPIIRTEKESTTIADRTTNHRHTWV